MIVVKDKHLCCGCGACVQICPKHCISFNQDTEGFLYPFVEKSICINCGLCEKVCPVYHEEEPSEPIKVFAAKNTNDEELVASSSGGLFILLAKITLLQGGVVFGARFDEQWNVIHSYAETLEGVKFFMGSKYVQSRIGNSYLDAKRFLKVGRKVLFTGTPCQIAGLKNFLQRDYDNLLTVDVICHGVPSPMAWQRYLSEIKHTIASDGKNSVSLSYMHPTEGNALVDDNFLIESISFRDKRTGWQKYSFALTLAKASADGKKNTVSLSQIFQDDPYMKLFLNNFTLRPSCYSCPSKSGKSKSDLTIADYWGIQNSHPELYDNRGVGLLIVNSEKGKQIVDRISADLLTEVSFAEAISYNRSYSESVVEPLRRNLCFRLLKSSKKSLDRIFIRLIREPLSIRIKVRIRRIIDRIICV